MSVRTTYRVVVFLCVRVYLNLFLPAHGFLCFVGGGVGVDGGSGGGGSGVGIGVGIII